MNVLLSLLERKKFGRGGRKTWKMKENPLL